MANYTWYNPAGGNWTTVTNWSASAYPALGDTVDITQTDITANRTITVPTGLGAPSYISVDDIGDTNGNGIYYTWTLNAGSFVLQNSSMEFHMPYLNSRDGILGVPELTLNTTITGNGNITKTGPGIITLNNSSSFIGSYTVNSGWLNTTNGAAFGDPSNTINFYGDGIQLNTAIPQVLNINVASLYFGYSIAPTGSTATYRGKVNLIQPDTTFEIMQPTVISGAIGGSGTLTKGWAGGATLTLNSTESNLSEHFNGVVTISTGTLNTNNFSLVNASLNYSSVYDGIFTYGANARLGNLNGDKNLALNATLILGTRNENGTYSGNFTGGGQLTKTGSGDFSIYSDTTRTGATVINEGFITLYSSAALGNTTTNGITVANSGTLAFSFGTSSAVAKALSLGGAGIAGDGLVLLTTGGPTIPNPITLTSPCYFDGGYSDISLTSGNSIAGTHTSFAIINATNILIDKVIAIGSGSLTINTGGMLTLGRSNPAWSGSLITYGGTTTYINNAGCLTYVALSADGGELRQSGTLASVSIGGFHSNYGRIWLENISGSRVPLNLGAHPQYDNIMYDNIYNASNVAKTGSGVVIMSGGFDTQGSGTLTVAAGGGFACGSTDALYGFYTASFAANSILTASNGASFGGVVGFSGSIITI